jgi:3-phenylpropionate/trans-cinnamate dioxygenase ferredoxin subunit
MYRLACEIDRLNLIGMTRVVIQDKPILIAYHRDQFYALSDVCPHMGASLSQGTFADGKVTCPRHHARFDVVTGEVEAKAKILFMNLPTHRATTYPVRIENGHVYIDL